jgi:hypothetical protein
VVTLSAAATEALFTRADGSFLFARWGRPIVPVVFGLDPGSLPVVKGAIEAVVTLAGHRMAETDPELGANLMLFFLRDWDELLAVRDLDRLIPDLAPLVARLQAAGANQYRVFRFDPSGAIRACFAFVRMDAHMTAVPAETLALNQAVQVILLWSDTAFTEQAALMVTAGGATILSPDVGDLIRVAYDPALPAMSQDRALALRIAARLSIART